jgi:hypothetical protein
MDRRTLVRALVMLADQPDQGTVDRAGRNIDEYLTAMQRSELSWIQKALDERVKRDSSGSKFFEHVQDIIKSRLSQLED